MCIIKLVRVQTSCVTRHIPGAGFNYTLIDLVVLRQPLLKFKTITMFKTAQSS